MKKLQDFIIPFSQLKEGLHEFSFEVDDQFFKFFDNPDIPGGSLKIWLELHKNSTFLELKFVISGKINTICDRCLDGLTLQVQVKETLFVRFGESHTELEDNVIIMPKEENRIDISQYIYEYAALSLPVKKVHPSDESGKELCNPGMLEILTRHSAESVKKNNPVWDKLKNMIN